MHHSIATRQCFRSWKRPGRCRLDAVHLQISSRRVAKCTSATLGVASTRVEPMRQHLTPLSFRLISRPLIRLSSSTRFVSPTTPTVFNSDARPGGDQVGQPDGLDGFGLDGCDRAALQIINGTGIPSEHDVLHALLHLHRAAASLTAGPSMSQSSRGPKKSETAASSLLSLDGSVPDSPQSTGAHVSISSGPSNLADHVSQVAFEVVVHPNVVITPNVLEAYIVIQARLGRVETLPHVLDLYGSKPAPREQNGLVEYVARNRNKAASAVPSRIVDRALDAAIDVRHLDAAVGIIENTYAAKAFMRQKMLRHAMYPAALLAMVPPIIWFTASWMATLQKTYEHETFTWMAVAGLTTYVVCTGSLGLIALATHNDHMVRVTWAPGTPLRYRWKREEERAAYDKVACAFGFSNSLRYGEEETGEFHILHKFLMRKSLILDSVSLMKGMA